MTITNTRLSPIQLTIILQPQVMLTYHHNFSTQIIHPNKFKNKHDFYLPYTCFHAKQKLVKIFTGNQQL